MANWIKLKKAIADVIKTNGNEEITGAIMQQTLISIVDNLGGNAQFGGVAVPSTVPADTDGSLFYLASTQGTYPNFNNIEVDASEMAVFTKNTSGTWVKTSLPIQHPTIKKPLLIGGNLAAVTKGTGVALSVPTLNADGTETASELSIEAATPSNNGTMTKDQVNTLKEVDDFYTRMTDFVVGDNDDTALINIEATEQNSINLKYKTLDIYIDKNDLKDLDDDTYYILFNCVDCIYVHLLSKPEKRNICPAEMAGNSSGRRKKVDS